MSTSILLESHLHDGVPANEISTLVIDMIGKLYPTRDATEDLGVALDLLHQVKDANYWWPDFQKKAWLPALKLENCEPILLILDYLNVEKSSMRKIYFALLQHMIVMTDDYQLKMTNIQYLPYRDLQQLEDIVLEWRRDLVRWGMYCAYPLKVNIWKISSKDIYNVFSADWSSWNDNYVVIASENGWLPRLKEMVAIGKGVPELWYADTQLYKAYVMAAGRAACNKDMECLQFLISILPPESYGGAMGDAIFEGNLDIVKLLHTRGCEFSTLRTVDDSDVRLCFKKDSVEVLKYLHENGCEIRNEIGHATVVRAWKCTLYLLDNGESISDDRFLWNVCNSDIDLDTFQKIRQGRTITSSCVSFILLNCRMEVVRYACSLVDEISLDVIDFAYLREDGLELVKFLHGEKNVPWTMKIYYSPDPLAIQYAIDNGCPRISRDFLLHLSQTPYQLQQDIPLESLRLGLEPGYVVEEDIITQFVTKRSRVVPVLHKHGCYWGPRIWIAAICAGETGMLEYIQHSTPSCPWNPDEYELQDGFHLRSNSNVTKFLRKYGYIS